MLRVFSFCLLLLFGARPIFGDVLSWNQSVWVPATKQKLTLEQQRDLLREAETVVIGEEHYNIAVQAGEAALIDLIGSLDEAELLVGWEFLNTIDRLRISEIYHQYQEEELSTDELLRQLFPQGNPPQEYAVVLEASRRQRALLLPTNLSRAQKSPVTRGGIEALDPNLKPKDFELGGAFYFERFKETMGTHPLPYPLENYFAAQSLTDEVMASELLATPTQGRRLLIIGSFHGDYRDGVVQNLERRSSPKEGVTYVKVLDASRYSEKEVFDLFFHPRYGPIADLLYIVNEPRPTSFSIR